MQATKSTGLGICVSNIFQILQRERRKALNEDRSKLRIYFLSTSLKIPSRILLACFSCK